MQMDMRGAAWRRWAIAVPILVFAVVVTAFLVVTLVNSHQPEPQDGVYPEEVFGIPVHTELIPETLPARPCEKRTIKYVVIHETGNTAEGSNAAGHSAYLLSGKSGDTSWHYTVDDHEIYHHIPDDEIAWHAGDRRTRDGGNLCGIGVELCVNADGDFEKTFDNAARLTAYLLQTYGLKLGAVKQHADFMDKNCPQTIRDNDRWPEFLEKVHEYKNLLYDTESLDVAKAKQPSSPE